jgi:hypothetical protein
VPDSVSDPEAIAERERKLENLRWLVEQHVPAAEAAVRAGWPTPSAAERMLLKMGETDLAKLVRRDANWSWEREETADPGEAWWATYGAAVGA